MKLLKTALYTILGTILLYIVACAFAPKSFGTNKSIVVNTPASVVFQQVADFNNWSAWSPWKKNDPEMTATFAGTPATIGHEMTWKSKKEGNGRQEIIEMQPNTSLKIGLHFSDDPNEVFYSNWKFEGDSTSTRVTWDMDSGTMPFMARGLAFIFNMKGTISVYYEQGLKALKQVSENGPGLK